MKELTVIVMNEDGKVVKASEEAARLLGIPVNDLIEQPLLKHVIFEHHVRFQAEIEALANGEESHGRVSCTVVGLDGISRRLSMAMTAEGKAVRIGLSRHKQSDLTYSPSTSLINTQSLLPVVKRMSSVVRSSSNKTELQNAGLKVFAEAVSSVITAAILEWGEHASDTPIATLGPFDSEMLRGVFRPAVLARLTRGDVVIKDSKMDGSESEVFLVVVPLLSGSTLHGIVVLAVRGHVILVPEEQQILSILGEIMGLGLEVLCTSEIRESYPPPHWGDAAATVALGRMSAGLAHEINNAVTILRNNLEQLMLNSDGRRVGIVDDYTIKDSLNALNSICEINDALRAFAPEETSVLKKIDLLPLLDMVVRSVRFYAKRGMNVVLDRPKGKLPFAETRSHHLIRSLFLILVEIVEAVVDLAIAREVRFGLTSENDTITLTMTITAGPFSLPTVLLAQLAKGGALSRQIAEAGGELTHRVDHKGDLIIAIALPSAERSIESLPLHSISGPLRRGKILIADEEVAIIRSLRRLLEIDHDILTAQTGEEALDIVKSNRDIDIILYDVFMSKLGGFEFFKEVSAFNLNTSNKIVFVSGGTTDAEVLKLLTDGSNKIIEKPFDFLRLSALIASMLE